MINNIGGGAQTCMPREWNTPKRERWNAPIHQILKAIDNHRREWMSTGNYWHYEKAEELIKYINELKTWIHCQEKNEI